MSIFFLSFWITNAQDLTGHWVAITAYDSGYYAELYLVQNQGGVYAGHCYDTEAGGYCRHWLDARYNTENQEFYGLDMELIAKSEKHSPTDYILRYEKGENGKEYLVGSSMTIPYEMRNNVVGLPEKEDLLQFRFLYSQGAHTVRYIKVSDDYEIYDDAMPLAMSPEQILLEKAAFPEVFEEEEVAKLHDEQAKNAFPELSFFDDVFKVPEVMIPPRKPPKPVSPQVPDVPEKQELPMREKPVEDKTFEEITTDAKKWKTPEMVADHEPTITEKKQARTDQLLSHINLKTAKVTLLIRDYGTVDNDTVTIFYNDKIIAENLRITSKAQEFDLELIPNKRNALVFVANNLGDVPPNTAKITIIADDKRYNYKLFTDEQNNALVLLENVAVE